MPDASAKTDDYVLGLGSNLGDRLASLRAAVAELEANNIRLLAKSRVYQTPPVGPPQPDFFNAAIRIEAPIAAEALIGIVMAVERRLGRVRPDPVRWGPRTMDIDVLWNASGAIASPGLMVPHPRLHERAFALIPLLDVAPDAADPRTGQRYAELAAARETLEEVGPL